MKIRLLENSIMDKNEKSVIIKYDGKWPCLCMGHLVVTIGGKEWDFGEYCLTSGGEVTGSPPDWDFKVTTGPWKVDRWPDGFPECYKIPVVKKINCEIPHGCCGGCI